MLDDRLDRQGVGHALDVFLAHAAAAAHQVLDRVLRRGEGRVGDAVDHVQAELLDADAGRHHPVRLELHGTLVRGGTWRGGGERALRDLDIGRRLLA